MSSFVRVTRRAIAVVALLAGIAGCSSLSRRSTSASPERQPLSESERIAHALSRLTFGARPGDAERVKAMGLSRWMDQQLRPATIDDRALDSLLASKAVWNQGASGAAATGDFAVIATKPLSQLMNDSALKAKVNQLRLQVLQTASVTDNLYSERVARAQLSERQLLEVVTDFWENHFSVYSGKMPAAPALVAWDREVIRPHAFGKFRDLLGAVAHSPAMLFYLDNHLSTRRGLNENYARELMELHTLGVDGGYTQKDVQEVARALTGWTIDRTRRPAPAFIFRRDQHDTNAKVVLGHVLPSGRGIEDGEDVLDILARHPSTARYIAFKLTRRLVSDEPPPELVARAAATFTRTDGDIAEVVRTIVTSREFFSRAAFRAKVKTPYQLVISARRALDAPADTTPQTARLIARRGQASFGWLTPDGWPEKGIAWMTPGTMYSRIKLGTDLAEGRVAGVAPRQWRDWPALSSAALDVQVDGVVNDVLGHCADSLTRATMLGIRPAGDAPSRAAGEKRLRELLAIALASPEFQRR